MAKRKKTKTSRAWRFLKFQIVLISIVLLAIAYYFIGGYATKVASLRQEAVSLVASSSEETFRASETSIVYDVNGDVISYVKGEKDVYYLTYDEIPLYAKQALISVEDKKFYSHHGVDYRAIVRAVWAMFRNGRVTQGASTITQQLARDVFLTQDRTWERKIEEIYIAVELEKKYTKEEILEFYINNIYFKNGYYGLEAASQGYFSKSAAELSLSQLAFLCAIPNNPSYYNPLEHIDNTITRRNKILKNMLEDKMISEQSYNEATSETIELCMSEEIKNNYAETFTYYCATRALMELDGFSFKYDFSSEEQREAYNESYEEAYNENNAKLFTGGYRIYTSLDLEMQETLQQSVDNGLARFKDVSEDGIYTLQSAAVCIDNNSGMVKAIVGGRSQDVVGYTLNRAYQSYRQPGSSIKPILVYTPALERGYTADSIVSDEPIEDGP
ncbi:MAG: penicillin-binding protein, partial [Lachnospiraceae bacterium]|nr:penicillin-binding protein [Lachnospiraceae bacterium]